MRFRAYRTTSEDKIYFQFLSTRNEELFNSVPYDDREACFEGIRTVLQVASDSGRYQMEETDGGTHYFNLTDDQGQLLGRSIDYDTANDAKNAMEHFQMHAPFATSKQAAPKPETPTESTPPPAPTLEFFEEKSKDISFGEVTIDDPDRGYFFTYVQDGQVVMMSRAYSTATARNEGLNQFKVLLANQSNYRRTTLEDAYTFSLHDESGHAVAASRPFLSELARETMIERLSAMTPMVGATPTPVAATPTEKPTEPNEYPACESIPKTAGVITIEGGIPTQYFFIFNHPEGRTVLRSPAANSAYDRDELLRKIVALSNSGKNYSVVAPSEGEQYITIKNDDGEELARSCPYDSREALEKDLLWVVGGQSGIDQAPNAYEGTWIPGAAATGVAASLVSDPPPSSPEPVIPEPPAPAPEPIVEPEPTPPPSSKKENLHYLACDQYPKGDRFESFKEGGKHYFSFNDADEHTFLRSRGFETEKQRDAAIQEVIRQASDQDNFYTETNAEGQHEYALQSSSYKELARSCPYANEADMIAALAWISGEESPIGKGSALVGGLLTSALAVKGGTPSGAGPVAGSIAPAENPFTKEVVKEASKEVVPEPEKIVSATPTFTPVDPAPVQNTPPPVVEQKSGGGMKWLWPLLILLLLGLLGILFWKGCFDQKKEVPPPVEKPIEKPDPLGPDATELGLTEGTVAYDLANFLSDPTAEAPKSFGLDQILFDADSDEVKTDENTQRQLKDVATVLKAYPNMRFGLLGHTDAAEGDNEALGENRATAVYQALVDLGVSETQIRSRAMGGEDIRSASLEVSSKKQLLGPDAIDLGMPENTTEYALANFLSDPNSTVPRNFTPDQLSFKTNDVRLPGKSKTQMQNLARVMMTYPDARFEITGNTGSTERPSYGGNKELSLGDARANSVYQVLVNMGASETQLSNGGEGSADEKTATIRVTSR